MESISRKIFKEGYLKLKEVERKGIFKFRVHFNKDIYRRIFKVEESSKKTDI